MGDFANLSGIAELQGVRLDGALLANALHYVAEPDVLLDQVRALVRSHGRIVIIEYDREMANRWVPYPLPIDRLGHVMNRAGLASFEIVTRRPSAYQGVMYCAVGLVPPDA
jgi:hypothetical protein